MSPELLLGLQETVTETTRFVYVQKQSQLAALRFQQATLLKILSIFCDFKHLLSNFWGYF